MNIHNGQILGLGSSPTYDPSIFAKPRGPAGGLQGAHRRGPGAPLFDRAIQRPLSDRLDVQADHRARGARLGRARPRTTIINDTGVVQARRRPGAPQRRRRRQRADRAEPGAQGLLRRLLLQPRLSHGQRQRHGRRRPAPGLGAGARDRPADGHRRRRRGRGPAADAGVAQRALPQAQEPDSPGGKDVVPDDSTRPDRPWTVGDNVNLAVGQGDLQADPLQMAVAYAAIANGGDVVRPHVGLRRRGPAGARRSRRSTRRRAPRRHRPRRPAHDHGRAPQAPRWSRAAPPIRSSATSRSTIAGKTGTAQRDRPGRTSPGTWRWRRTDEPEERGRRDDRARRLRRRHRRPGRAARSSTRYFNVDRGRSVERRSRAAIGGRVAS